MPVVKKKSKTANEAATELTVARGLLLARIALCGGATRVQIVRDLGPLTSHKLSPGEWRETVGARTSELLNHSLCTEKRGRLSATPAGMTAVERFLGAKNPKKRVSWAELRDVRLVAKALELKRIGPTVLKALTQPDGLRSIILQKEFNLNLSGMQTPSVLRAALAMKALERAFGNKIKTDLGSGTGFSAKAGRLLAGQLSQSPRDFGTDVRLVQGLAAEAVDARQTDPDALRLSILRKFVSDSLAKSDLESLAKFKTSQPKARKATDVTHIADNDTGIKGAGPHAIRRPDPEEFARIVKEVAASCAEGWAGNRKAPISKVWSLVEQRHRGWALSPIEFKCMLAEAHRGGLLMLASADLKSKDSVAELEASAITYENTVWHLVRVIDDDDL